MDFKGKNILVVGGSSGIGLSLIKMLASQGAQLYNASRTQSDDWPEGVIHIPVDVLSDMNILSESLPENLHGLVYAVGSINLKPFSRYTDDDFMSDYKLNVIGAARCIQLAHKSLRKAAGASIVLLSSVAARTGMPYHASIAAAKGGVESLALSLAAEFAAQNIRVNVVAPSLTDTPLAGNLLSTSFLLSEQSGWISGQILGVDGGMGNLKTS